MRQPSESFVEKVQQAWGNPERVAEVGLDETFHHDEVFGFDHDDQVRNATRVGIIAGQTADQSVEAFVTKFTALLNEN